MKTLTDHLTNYASYHRDRRNIATHFLGIPVIVVAVATLLSRPAVDVLGVTLSPAVLAIGGTLAFYLALDRRFFVVMAVLMTGAGALGAWFAAQSTAVWLTAGLGMFVGGWMVQFVGHIFEGRKPAFVDDLIGLLVGPLFIVAEAAFALGLRPALRDAVTRGAGPTRAGRAPQAATGAV